MKPVPATDELCMNASRYAHRRIGIVTNDIAATSWGVTSRLALLQAGLQLKIIFSPEHGITAAGPDGMAQSNHVDVRTGLPVVSLYGQSLQPMQEALSQIDLLLFDIPDVGCRFYTYLWTMTHVMEACAQQQLELMVLDRPNPIGGDLKMAEGPMLNEQTCSSFIGRWSIPIRHSCTLAELALYFKHTRITNLHLTIMPCKHWDRSSSFSHPQWFQPTSPAIRDIQTALLYPGTGFWEGVNLQEGRGTEFPFSQFGAPWIGDDFAHALSMEKFDGLQIKPQCFVPLNGRYAGQTCWGASLHPTSEHLFRPVQCGLKLLQLIMRQYPQHLQTTVYPTRANPAGDRHLDLLMGVSGAFQLLMNIDIKDLQIGEQWMQVMRPFLLY